MEAEAKKWLYETILSGPGMEDQVKLSIAASRKVILLLSEILESGLTGKGSELKECLGQHGVSELGEIKDHILEKSGLVPLAEQLKKIK